MTTDQPRQDSLYLYCISWRDLIPALNFVWMIVGPVMRPTDTPSIDSRKACRKRGVSWWACRGFVSKVEAFVRGRGAPRTIVDPDRQARLGQVRSFPAKMMKANDDSSRLIIDTSLYLIPRVKFSLLNPTTSLLFFSLSKRIRNSSYPKIRLVYIYIFIRASCDIYIYIDIENSRLLKRLEFEDRETIHKTLTTSLPTSHPNRRTSVSHSRLKGVEMKGKAVVERIRANRTKRKS